ncbi:MAG: VCBS repeat-containing protein [Verrucomicrobia bacterium]|nr:VCBS repeat-containing protein [Verrucomicrobiota bacterium]
MVAEVGDSPGAAWGDYDNDGDLDLYVANRLGPSFLHRNEGRGVFTRITTGVIVTDAADSNGCTWADYDNDGDLDLFVASFTQSAVFLYRNQGDGVFERVLDEPPALPGGHGNSVVLADYDGDGFLDLFVSKWAGGNNQLYRNRGNGNRWFKIRVAQKAGELSPNGLRARLKTRTDSGESWQMRELVAFDGWGGTDSTLHFGLGTASTVDVLVVTWPSGATREYRNLPANATMTLSGTPEYLSVHPTPGFFTGSVTVTLTSRVAGGEVRYTLDGTEPTLSSPRYEEPLVLTSSFRVSAELVPPVIESPAFGTTAEEIVVTWQPLRVFGLGQLDATQEGRRFDVPVILNSGSDVGGLSFEVRYDPEWLRDPAVTFTDVLAGALAEVNTDTPGTVRVTLSRAGTGIAPGEQVLANLSFRARSVPEPTRTDLGLVLLDHADERGTPILLGTAVVPGTVPIQPRRFTGDNNGNDRLDIGHATVIQRFVASLEPVRPWDVRANDLNESRSLDSGDVVRVLRAVVGLDPQPRPAGGGALGRGAIQPSGAGGPIHGAPPVAPVLSGPAAILLSDAPRAMPGEQIIVRVELAGLGQSISGMSFRIEFPAQALRLVEGGVRVGPMVPAGALGVWLADAGSINVAFSALQAWSTASSRVAELVFEVLPGVAAQREWTLVLGSADVTSPDGYTVRPLAGSTLVVGALPVFGPTIGFEPDGRFQLAFSGRAGTSYVIEASSDLHSWTPLDTVYSTGELMRWSDGTASAERVRFYRLRQGP